MQKICISKDWLLSAPGTNGFVRWICRTTMRYPRNAIPMHGRRRERLLSLRHRTVSQIYVLSGGYGACDPRCGRRVYAHHDVCKRRSARYPSARIYSRICSTLRTGSGADTRTSSSLKPSAAHRPPDGIPVPVCIAMCSCGRADACAWSRGTSL